MPVSARIFSIVRSSLHDGPGVRTVVYFAGCPLRCRWCHNPEGFFDASPVTVMADKCIGCGRCFQICPQHHIRTETGEKVYNPVGCKGCGRCAEKCPSGALKKTSWIVSADELMKTLRKDAHFYERTGGGVTLSGGECLLYPEMVMEIGKKCRREGINLLAETSAFVNEDDLMKAAEWIDQFYIDVKHMDSEKHRLLTGEGNERIFRNIRSLSNRNADILLRTPVIPGINDDWENLLSTARFAQSLKGTVRGLCLLKYNPLGVGKYAHVGLAGESFGEDPQSSDEMLQICSRLNAAIGEASFVYSPGVYVPRDNHS